MTTMCDREVYTLALQVMEDNRDAFPAADFDALVDLLACNVQDALDDFVNPDYIEFTMKHLRRKQARETK